MAEWHNHQISLPSIPSDDTKIPASLVDILQFVREKKWGLDVIEVEGMYRRRVSYPSKVDLANLLDAAAKRVADTPLDRKFDDRFGQRLADWLRTLRDDLDEKYLIDSDEVAVRRRWLESFTTRVPAWKRLVIHADSVELDGEVHHLSKFKDAKLPLGVLRALIEAEGESRTAAELTRSPHVSAFLTEGAVLRPDVLHESFPPEIQAIFPLPGRSGIGYRLL